MDNANLRTSKSTSLAFQSFVGDPNEEFIMDLNVIDIQIKLDPEGGIFTSRKDRIFVIWGRISAKMGQKMECN